MDCNCINNELNENDNDTNSNNNFFNESYNNKCDFKYLKSLCIDKIYNDDCKSLEITLNKLKLVRNSFFTAKTAIHNFLLEIEGLSDSLISDLSDNDIELNSLKEQYFTLLNSLLSNLYTAFKIKFDSKNLINIDFIKAKNDNNIKSQRSIDIKFSKNDCDIISISTIPGINLIMNIENKVIKIKFSEPEYFNNISKNGFLKKPPDVTKTFIITPSILISNKNIEHFEINNSFNFIDENNTNDDIFNNISMMKDFFEEFQSFQDNYIIDNNKNYGNEILELFNYLNKTINKFESSYNYLVQINKINNE